jgi:hypothetical protein
VATDFTTGSPTWTPIGGVTNMGAFGDTAELISSKVIAEKRVRKAKGTQNAGSQQIVCNLDYSDDGQLALRAAAKTKDTYAFRVTFNDAPTGGTPSIRYYTGLVMSASEQFNEADNVMELQITVELDSNIVEVAAAEA